MLNEESVDNEVWDRQKLLMHSSGESEPALAITQRTRYKIPPHSVGLDVEWAASGLWTMRGSHQPSLSHL